MIGFLRFEQESRGEKLWVPQDSKAQNDRVWVEKMFPEESTQVNFILERPNVLTADVIKQVCTTTRRTLTEVSYTLSLVVNTSNE